MIQRSSTTAFAKSTRPEIGGVVRRELLFARVDGNAARTVAWISAPPGFGKTTLAASYLEARSHRWAWYQVDPDDDDGETFFHYVAHAVRKVGADGDGVPAFGPEHRDDLAGFSRRFFRALFSSQVGLTALVLDNLHELSNESPLRTILEAGLPQVPRSCCVIVTSRAQPPVGLSRLRPDGQMVLVAADDLRITPDELGEMARLRGKPLTPELLMQLHGHADGWAAALVLMVEHYKLAQAQAQLPTEATPKAVFDYLAGEIFERFEPPTQRLLLQLACLPRITIDIARALCGDEAAARVLFNLAHNDYFVRELVGPEGRVFVFHPLLREFLLYRAARDLPQAVVAETSRRAARLLRESGQHEDALALYAERRDWAEVAAIAREQAGALLAQGRHATLAAWLELLPAQQLGDDAELLRASGAALAYLSPRAARHRFEEAFDAFRQSDDRRGMARCCLGIFDTVLREFDDLGVLDRWLAEFDRCRDALDGAESASAAAVVARMWREPGHPTIAQTRATHRSADGPALELARSAAALLGGEFVHSSAIAKGIEGATGSVALARATLDALRALLDGDHAAALAAGRAGLAIGAADAAHGHDAWLHLLCAAAALGLDDAESARAEIDLAAALPLRRGDQAFLHYLRFGLAQLGANAGLALREGRSAALLAVEAGLPWLECLARVGLAQALAASGDRPASEAQLRSAQALAQSLGSPLLRLATLFTQAAVAVLSGDEPAAVSPLQAALGLARELGLRHVPALSPALLGTLCAVALRRGIAVEHTRSLISAGKLVPPASALRLRRWPWAFELVTLGRFDLRRGGEAVEFSAKGPGRPVELLKVLISLGGQNVRADQLADALWPNVDADYAHKSFTATLHRLRRIFDEDDAVKLRDGRLGLNASMFWLDGWALDQVLADIDACFRDGDARVSDGALRGLVDEALSLYAGPFLLDEDGQPAYLSRREQLRARMLRALARAVRRWEENGQGDAVVDAYLRCIDADDQCEAFYRQLMLCHQRRGESVEALATYERLQAVLLARSRSTPSAETQAIYARLRA